MGFKKPEFGKTEKGSISNQEDRSLHEKAIKLAKRVTEEKEIGKISVKVNDNPNTWIMCYPGEEEKIKEKYKEKIKMNRIRNNDDLSTVFKDY